MVEDSHEHKDGQNQQSGAESKISSHVRSSDNLSRKTETRYKLFLSIAQAANKIHIFVSGPGLPKWKHEDEKLIINPAD